jgi:hypothetical protein
LARFLAEGELATDKLLDKIWDYKQIRPRIMPPRCTLVKGDCIGTCRLQIFNAAAAGDFFRVAPYTRRLCWPCGVHKIVCARPPCADS